ncbi:MAG: hypothetical protein IKV96_02810, partial [Firmicutes bacterium]|nr:hypothetical protein [Bacillota bacterium]
MSKVVDIAEKRYKSQKQSVITVSQVAQNEEKDTNPYTKRAGITPARTTCKILTFLYTCLALT